MIRLYAIDIGKIKDTEIEAYLSFISEQRKDRIKRYRNVDDGKRSLLAELMIRKIVIRQFNKKNKEIYFDYNHYGKPFVKDLRGFHFNLSHSGRWVVCATGQKAVGVDIQEIREINPEILAHWFTEQENHELALLARDKKREYFYRGWTRKESFLKALGVGFMESGDETGINFEDIFFRT
jgi:4'-phosphopantetheinyl transferase